MNDVLKLIVALVTPAQALEDTFQQLLTQRGISNAIGAQLDQLGEIVGQSRGGLGDDTYRRYIRARIATNRSNGKTEDLILIARLIVNDPTCVVNVQREGVATVVVRLTGIAVPYDIAQVIWAMLQTAKSAGVRLLTEGSEVIPADTFRFDSGPGFDVGHLAYALD